MQCKLHDKIVEIKIFLCFIVVSYSSWFTQSKASNVSGKDTEAKERIREFYSFVVNGVIIYYISFLHKP